ncbi:MAG: hypothetical protein PSV19_00580 [Polaromonas sp.]|nr:hypothetical protein [Polaromonas sp.]MDI1338256.1 hypothetical protein [Polaromonas sp.]
MNAKLAALGRPVVDEDFFLPAPPAFSDTATKAPELSFQMDW